MNQRYEVQLTEKIRKRFNAEELRELCFQLNIEYDDLPGSGRAGKARELVRFCERKDRLGDLVVVCDKMYPTETWTEVDDGSAPQPESLTRDPIRPDKLSWYIRLPSWIWALTGLILGGLLISSIWALSSNQNGNQPVVLPTDTPTHTFIEIVEPNPTNTQKPTNIPTNTAPAPDIILPTPIPTALLGAIVEISGVVGVGELTEEAVQIINSGTRQTGLVDWTLSDESGFIYTFNQVTLFGEGAGILIHTEAGTDGPTDLYWGLELPILVSGKILSLKDADGNVVSTYTVP